MTQHTHQLSQKRELYGTLQHFQAPRAILVSLNGFTRGVYEFVSGKPIELWDVHSLIDMQKRLDTQAGAAGRTQRCIGTQFETASINEAQREITKRRGNPD